MTRVLKHIPVSVVLNFCSVIITSFCLVEKVLRIHKDMFIADSITLLMCSLNVALEDKVPPRSFSDTLIQRIENLEF